MDLLTRSYSTAEVADITGVDGPAISNWASRGLITGPRGPVGRGRSRSYSWYGVMQIGCADALMKMGISSPADAFRASAYFAHTGTLPSGWANVDEPPDPKQRVRIPGLPYPWYHGPTFLFVAGDHSSVQAIGQGNDAVIITTMGLLDNPLGFIALNVTEVFNRALGRLELDPNAVLAEAYGRFNEGAP